MKYIVYRVDEKNQIDVAGIYDKFEDAKARHTYVEDNFTIDKGEWNLDPVPDMPINFGSVIVLNKKD